MKMNLKEMKTLYTFGCPNREATVERLRYVAALLLIRRQRNCSICCRSS